MAERIVLRGGYGRLLADLDAARKRLQESSDYPAEAREKEPV